MDATSAPPSNPASSTSSSSAQPTIGMLPEGLLAKALAFLDPAALFAAAQVSHKWNALASSDQIWERYVKYVTVPPSGAWKPKGRKMPEPEENNEDDDERDERAEQKGGGDKEKEKDTKSNKEKDAAQKWDGSKALQWLRQQTDEGRPRVLGGICYEVEGMKDQDIAKRKNKEIFRQHAGRGWYLPGFTAVTKHPEGGRVQLQANKGGKDKFKLVVDDKPVFKAASPSPTGGFSFERVIGKEEASDATNAFEKSLNGLGMAIGLQDKLRKGNLRVDTKTLNTLATLLPSGKYDVAFVQIWPQLIKCGTNDHPESGTRGDYWRHEWTKDGWGCKGVPENERYYRCWTHTRLMNWPLEENRLPGLDVLVNAFVIPLQHASNVDNALVNEYKREWQQDASYLPTAVAVGAWDQRTIPSSYDNPLIRVTSGVHLVNFLIDGHHKIQAAAELGRPLNLLTFITTEDFSENRHEAILRLANTRYLQPAPKREPIKIVSTLPRGPGEHSSLYVRLGYCVNATAVEIAELLKKDYLRPKRVVVSQDTWQILIQLHDNDLTSFHNLFSVTSPSATASIMPYHDGHANGGEPGTIDNGAGESKRESPAVDGTARQGNGEAGHQDQPQIQEGEKGEQTKTVPAEGKGGKGAPATQGAAKGQKGAQQAGGKPKQNAGKGGGTKTRGRGKGGKGGRGGKYAGNKKGDDTKDEEYFVASVVARARPKWLYLKRISEIGHNVIHPKIPIEEDLEEFNTWDERDLSIWTFNKRRGSGGALGNRPRRNNWRENGAQLGGDQQGGWRGNDGNYRGGGQRHWRGGGGRRGAPSAPLGYAGGPGSMGMSQVGYPPNPGVVGPTGFIGGGPGSPMGPRVRSRPNRGVRVGGGRGRYPSPAYYPKFPPRPTMVFAQELPHELANIQGVPLPPTGNMIYVNPAGGYPMEEPMHEGPSVVGPIGAPSHGGMGMAGVGMMGMGNAGGMPPAPVPAQVPPMLGGTPPARTGGGGLCHFFFNTTIGCRYGEHCWFSHELPNN